MRQSEMLLLVPQKLKQIEKEYGIRILYAAESGSRAWGTNSAESDFDVRFVYIRPREEYLRLEKSRDVLEFPIEEGWDMCGWDLTKTLQLLHNSNSQIYEWFASPVVYVDGGFSQRFRPVMDAYFSVRTAVYHYLHQAVLKEKQARKAESPKVKHYLYTLQHIASARWILERQSMPPISFQAVTVLLPKEIGQVAGKILFQKTTQPEAPHMSRHLQLEAWAAEEFIRIQQAIDQLPKEPEKDWEMLDRFFLTELERLQEM